MAGHLFVTRGDLRHLACDAILVPSGRSPDGRLGEVTEAWHELVGGRTNRQGHWIAKTVPSESERVVEVTARQRRQPSDDPGQGPAPAVWIGHTGDTADEPPHWYADAIREFVRRAPHRVGDARPFGLSGRPLLGIPLVGTDEGGMSGRKGEVVNAIVEGVVDQVEKSDADVVIVAWDAAAYAALQQARLRLGRWDGIDDLETHARSLADKARDGGIVLFTGAGTGAGAGLPSWRELLRKLGKEAGFDDGLGSTSTSSEPEPGSKLARFLELDPRDAASLLKQAFGSEAALTKRVADHLKCDHVSLVHQLLASWPVTEAVTTNFDDLFETAWRDAGRAPTILPDASEATTRNWLLKLHGSADENGRIVFARDDYLRWEGEGVALAGLVQAMLLTRHLVFVGYSLSDDNFHRIVHQTQAALDPAAIGQDAARQTSAAPFGTAITFDETDLWEPIWADRVDFVQTRVSDGTGESGSKSDAVKAASARRLAIFLDRVGALAAAPAAHLLDDSYKALFDDARELSLSEKLREVRRAAKALPSSNPVGAAVLGALNDLAGVAEALGTKDNLRGRDG